MVDSKGSGVAWYRFFWPWFIVGLLGISVLGSLWTVSIAFGLGDLEAGVVEPVGGSSQGSPLGEELRSESDR